MGIPYFGGGGGGPHWGRGGSSLGGELMIIIIPHNIKHPPPINYPQPKSTTDTLPSNYDQYIKIYTEDSYGKREHDVL